MAPAIATSGLTKRYGATLALDGLDLEVPEGIVFGFLGPNGAGKSTTIRLLMGLLRPTSGSATVLGLDALRQRELVHRRVGYLPGDFVAYRDLTGHEYLHYLAELRGDVETSEIDLLAKRFELDLDRHIGSLSHGNRQKVGIVQAFMHRPELVVLDEPTSGLDPLMQREFLALVREEREAGRTVFLSSHVLTEVEEIADVVGILRCGRLVATTEVDELRTRTRRRVELTFAGGEPVPSDALARVANVRQLDVEDRTAHVVIEGSMAELLRVAAPFGVDQVVSNEVDLEGIFLEYYGHEEG
ncbi:MAG: ABC transporter ATP-binding protein [Acidimicrobiales bacterium]|jgi:ABC-2 type transport system ATP-binding protein|nr:ABC transporter ATP-binding protein [Acidimicrobiales bacterium]